MANRQNQIGVQALTDIFYSSIGFGFQALLQFISMIILSRLLTPKDIGIVGAALIVINLTAIFSRLGVAPAVIQKKQLTFAHIKSSFSISMIFGILFTVIIYFSSEEVANFFHMPELEKVIKYYSPIFIIMGIATTSEALLQRNLEFKRLALLDIVSYATGYFGVGIVMAMHGYGYWALVAAFVSHHLIRSIALIIVRPPPFNIIPSFSASSDLLKYGTGQTLARIAIYGGNSGDKAVVGKYIGAETLGEYARAHQLIIMPMTMLGSVIDKVLFAAMSRIQDNQQQLNNNYRRCLMLITLIYIPVGLALFITADLAVAVLLGPQWGNVGEILQVLCLSMLFRGAAKVGDLLAKSTGAIYRRAIVQWISVIFVIAGTLFAAKIGAGAVGVAKAFVFAGLIQALLIVGLGCYLTGLKWYEVVSAYLPGVLVGTLIASITFMIINICNSYTVPDLVTFSLLFIVTVPIYLGILLYQKGSLIGKDGEWIYELIFRAVARN